MPLLIKLIQHTPSWVFVLFFILLTLGYLQSKNRTVSRSKLSIIPTVMIALSLYGVLSAFGIISIGLIFWILGVLISVFFGAKFIKIQGIHFSTQNQSYLIPGSWLPLALMMAIFFIKYAVGVAFARHLTIVNDAAFVGSVSFCYGLFSGIFFARTIIILRFAK